MKGPMVGNGRRLVFAGLVVALTAGMTACGDSDDSDPAATTATAPVTITVGARPGLLQATADAVWVATENGVERIDPDDNLVVATVTMAYPEYIVSDGTSLWASLFEANQLVRIDSGSNTIADTLEVPNNPGAAVVDDRNEVWVASHRGAAVLRFDDGATTATAEVAVGEPGPDGPIGLARGLDSIWVGTPNIFSVSEIDPDTNAVIAEFGIPPGANPCGDIVVAGGRVQVSSCRIVPSISVIDPVSGDVNVVELDGFSIAVAVVDDEAWWTVQSTTAGGPSQLVRIDATGLLTVVDVPGVTAIVGITVAFGSVWVSDEANGTVTRFPLDLLG